MIVLLDALPFEPLDPGLYRELVRRALAEDVGWGDVTTEVVVRRDQRARGVLLAKSPCVVAGGLRLAIDAPPQRQRAAAAVTIAASQLTRKWRSGLTGD